MGCFSSTGSNDYQLHMWRRHEVVYPLAFCTFQAPCHWADWYTPMALVHPRPEAVIVRLGGVHGFPMFSSPVSSHVENPLQMEALSGKINYKWWMFKPWLIDDTGGYHHPGSWRTQYQFLHLDDMSINSGVDFGIHSTNPRVDDNMYRSKSEGFFRLSKSGWSCPFASGAVSYSTPWWVCHGILEAGIRSVWSKPLFCRAGPVGLACGIRETCSEDEGYWWTLMECAVSTLDSRALSSTSQNLAGQIRWKLLLSGTTSLSGGCASKINHESSKGIMLHKQGGT